MARYVNNISQTAFLRMTRFQIIFYMFLRKISQKNDSISEDFFTVLHKCFSVFKQPVTQRKCACILPNIYLLTTTTNLIFTDGNFIQIYGKIPY